MFVTGTIPQSITQNLDSRASKEVRTLLLHALNCYQYDGANALELVSKASRILVGNIGIVEDDTVSTEKVADRGLAKWQIAKVKALVSERLPSSVSVGELAEIANLSTSYFCTLFKVTFGRSPHNYVVAQRVEFAKHLMETTSAPLSEIALSCGLADQAHLSRLFRRFTGVTPSAWRRRRVRGSAASSSQL